MPAGGLLLLAGHYNPFTLSWGGGGGGGGGVESLLDVTEGHNDNLIFGISHVDSSADTQKQMRHRGPQ